MSKIQCTLTPLCARRFLLKLRIKNGLTLDDLPKFCYSVHKNVVLRDFRGKTVVYRPFDAYLYLVDFLDIFFHGDYRKLNKFISFEQWGEVLEIFNDRINKSKENFRYHLTDNNLIIKYDDRIHVIFFKQKIALCNANRESIASLEILHGLCELFIKLYFPEFRVRLIRNKYVKLTINLPTDIITGVSDVPVAEENPSRTDHYFWNVFYEDLNAMTDYCKEIYLKIDRYDNLLITLRLNLETNNINEKGAKLPMRYRDLRNLLNFAQRIYNEIYVIWISP
jgi:hypothetical protein